MNLAKEKVSIYSEKNIQQSSSLIMYRVFPLVHIVVSSDILLDNDCPSCFIRYM